MKKSVFRRWAKFALWYIPLLVIVTVFISYQSNHGLGIEAAIADGFNKLVLFVFYSIFIITSIVKILCSWYEVKHNVRLSSGKTFLYGLIAFILVFAGYIFYLHIV